MADDLTDEERQLLINILTVEIEASKFPLSQRGLIPRHGNVIEQPIGNAKR